MQTQIVKDLFGNELRVGDQVVNVLIYKNEANFRKGTVETIETTPRGTLVYIRNFDTHRKTVKITNSKDKFICKNILKYDWQSYVIKQAEELQPSLFPDLF